MRTLADERVVRRFMRAFGAEAPEATRIYFTGGATAVLEGWRESTIDIDLRMVPERDALFRAIPRLKEQLKINVEIASPDHFIPVAPGWEERSPFIAREGKAFFHHFDLYAQALAKIERGHAQDGEDVQQMLGRGLIQPERLLRYFQEIEPQLYRYPALDGDTFRDAVERTVGGDPPPRVTG